MYWCPECGNSLYEETTEDLYCTCGFKSTKNKTRRTATGFVLRESYRSLKRVYDWDPPVLLRKPDEIETSVFDPHLLPFKRKTPPTTDRSSSTNIEQDEEPVVEREKEPEPQTRSFLSLVRSLSQENLEHLEIVRVLNILLDDRKKLSKFAYKGLGRALTSSEPWRTAVTYATNIRKVIPRFLMRKREILTIPRFMAKILSGTTQYNLSVRNYEEYRILEEGTRLLFNSPPPEPKRVLLEILSYNKGLRRIASKPARLQAIITVCNHYLECMLILEDIIEEISQRIKKQIGSLKRKIMEDDDRTSGFHQRKLSLLKLYLEINELALMAMQG